MDAMPSPSDVAAARTQLRHDRRHTPRHRHRRHEGDRGRAGAGGRGEASSGGSGSGPPPGIPRGFSYAEEAPVWECNRAIPPNEPRLAGGRALDHFRFETGEAAVNGKKSGCLPTGVVLDARTGVITGTPVVVRGSVEAKLKVLGPGCTIVASNDIGVVFATLHATVRC
jgi:hypothetical protein